jgi:hypothetical protein
MEKSQADSVHVDPSVAYEGYATISLHGGNPVRAVQAAYNGAVKRVTDSGRKPIMIRVLVHVAPE